MNTQIPSEKQLNRQEQLEESLNRINNESDSNRIRLETLRACFINVCAAFHDIVCVTHGVRARDSDWKTCSNAACKSNRAVLIKLGLD